MKRVTTTAQMRAAADALRSSQRHVALVPTMGALHRGHLSLVEHASDLADDVVVSVFVNPTQFDRPDDLATYPRDLDGDERSLEALGRHAPSVVFAPDAAEMYPQPPLTTVRVSDLTETLCGASRPGHFDGVATVVTKLLNIVRPDVAVFGRKDRQQLAVIERLAADLDLGVEIVGAPTVRDDDGVATSSRNLLLDDAGRAAARGLPRALAAATTLARDRRDAGGVVDVDELLAAARTQLDTTDGLALDYLEAVDPANMQPVTGPVERVVLAVAAFIDGVRLIDNVELGSGDEAALLDAVRKA